MNADFINDFRKKIIRDKDNRKFRWDFHENYEWLDSYWDGKFRNFNAFCKKYISYFWSLEEIQNSTKKIAFSRCVGNSKDSSYKPKNDIVKATIYLRNKLKFKGSTNKITDCRIVKCEFYNLCIRNSTNIWINTDYAPFLALMCIIRQIRNNLFHGNKLQIENKKCNRNKKLVQVAASITNVILDNLKNAELNEHVHN